MPFHLNLNLRNFVLHMKNLKNQFVRISITVLAMLIILPATIFAQGDVPTGDYPNKTDAKGLKQGAWKKADSLGTCIYVGQFKDNNPYGVFTYFDTDARKMSEINFMNGGPVQYGKMFSVTGKLQAQGKYINHEKDSLWTFFTEDGLLLSQETYKNGKKEGKSITYHPGTKNIAEISYFKKGLQDSIDLQYYADGKLESEGKYKNGNAEGKAIWYFPDGKVNISGSYIHGLKDGAWVYNNADGTVKAKETWKAGKLTSQAQIIKKDDFNKHVDDPQNPNDNNGGQEPGGQ